MGFSRQECWSGLPCPSPGDLPDTEIESGSPALQAGSLPSEPQVAFIIYCSVIKFPETWWLTTTHIFLLHSFCGSGIQKRLSWVVLRQGLAWDFGQNVDWEWAHLMAWLRLEDWLWVGVLNSSPHSLTVGSFGCLPGMQLAFPGLSYSREKTRRRSAGLLPPNLRKHTLSPLQLSID